MGGFLGGPHGLRGERRGDLSSLTEYKQGENKKLASNERALRRKQVNSFVKQPKILRSPRR